MTAIRVKAADFDGALNECLIAYARERSTYRLERGHRATSTGSGGAMYSTPGHMDWANGAEEERAEKIEIETICDALESVDNDPRPWRLALEFQAKNLWTGGTVWFSPRLPQDKAEREVLLLEARVLFAYELRRRKVRWFTTAEIPQGGGRSLLVAPQQP